MSDTFDDAIALYDVGNFAEACDIFEHLLNVADSLPERQLYLYNISSCHLSQGADDRARKYLEQLIKFRQEDQAHSGHGSIFDEMIKYLRVQLECKNVTKREKEEKEFDLLDEILLTLSELDRNGPNYMLLVDLVRTHADNMMREFWRDDRFHLIETVLNKIESLSSVDSDPNLNDRRRKNLAHVYFATDSMYEECIKMYEDLLPKSDNESILKCDPMILANLCVSYVLTGQNSDAEQLIKEVELEENDYKNFDYQGDDMSKNEPIGNNGSGLSHLQLMNLAIETLYCVKGNYQFGLGMMFKTMEPMGERLTPDSWYHAKRCILALLDKFSRRIVSVQDDLFDRLLNFLVDCETLGTHLSVECNSGSPYNSSGQPKFKNIDSDDSGRTVCSEARYLRSLCLNVIHD